ncbi:hypothetical protein ACQ4LE_006170 [Meloidogyne hapla]
MKNLPNEVKLDILKYLNIYQLFSVQQTNKYFYVLIDDHKFVLPCIKFKELSIHAPARREFYQYKREAYHFPLINNWKSLNKFPSFELEEKWLAAIEKRIPVLLRIGSYKEFNICVTKSTRKSFRRYYLKIPKFPKNIEQMLIIQHWLEQLFYCNYEIANFNELINPELIKLLFEENKRIPLKFNILGNCPILSTNSSCESLLDFILNNLKIGEDLQIDFSRVWNIDDNIEILFNLLIQEGGRFKKVYFQSIRESTIYKMIIKHIETSKDLTNIVNFISFNDMRWPIKLNIRAENIERRLVCNSNFNFYVNYRLTNIFNPNEEFYIHYIEYNDGTIGSININRGSKISSLQ